jgi:hypothetical protein
MRHAEQQKKFLLARSYYGYDPMVQGALLVLGEFLSGTFGVFLRKK